MSYSFEKLPGEKPANSSDRYSDMTDWERVHAMDDEDIVFDEDNPEILPGEWGGGIVKYRGRPATAAEIEEFKRQLLAYINRPRKTK